MDAVPLEVVQDLGLELDAFLTYAGVVLPSGVTGEVFIRELLEGGPGISANPSFVARLGVSLKHPGLHNQANFTEIVELIQERLAARRPATDKA